MALRYKVICNQRCDRHEFLVYSEKAAHDLKEYWQGWGYAVSIEVTNTGEETTAGCVRQSGEEGK